MSKNMENVEEFNKELLSINSTKPPISKAKITGIVKLALKATHYYKYVVQSVEKFIWKCKPQYKLPGLYVIDAIIHQARLQFKYKDVYAPRFARNLYRTFGYVFQCPDEDRKKVMRVLNLWSLNDFFKDELLKPIFELAEKIEKKKEEEAEEREALVDDKKSEEGDSENDEETNKKILNSSVDEESSGGMSKDLLLQLANLQSSLQNQNMGDILNNMQENNTNSNSLTKGIEFILSNPNLIKQLGELQNKFSLNQIKDLENMVENSIGTTITKVAPRPPSPDPVAVSQKHPSQLLAEESEFEKFLAENERSTSKRSRKAQEVVDLSSSPETQPQDSDLRSIDTDFRRRSQDQDFRSLPLSHQSSLSQHNSDATTKHISSKFNLDDISLPSNLNEIRLPPPPLPSGAPPLPPGNMDLTADLPMNLPLPPANPSPDSRIAPIQFNISNHVTNLSLLKNPLGELPNFSVPPPALSKPHWMTEPPPPLPPPSPGLRESEPQHELQSAYPGEDMDMDLSHDKEYENEEDNGQLLDRERNREEGEKSPSRSPGRRRRKSSRVRSRSRERRRSRSRDRRRKRKNRSRSRGERKRSRDRRRRSRDRSSGRRKARSRSRSRDRKRTRRSESRDKDPRSRDRERRSSRDKDRETSSGRGRSEKRDATSRDRDSKNERGEWSRSRDRSRNREEGDDDSRDEERRAKGFPSRRTDHISICTRTIWVGHLPKTIEEEELRAMFTEYGEIANLNLIPPRGCAFVTLTERAAAAQALRGLRHAKLQGKSLSLDWAPGKNCKDGEYREYWNVEQGVTYLPYSCIESTNFESLIEGCVFDLDTVPEFLRSRLEMIQASYEARLIGPPTPQAGFIPPVLGPGGPAFFPGGHQGPPPGCFPPFAPVPGGPPMMPPPGIRLPPPGHGGPPMGGPMRPFMIPPGGPPRPGFMPFGPNGGPPMGPNRGPMGPMGGPPMFDGPPAGFLNGEGPPPRGGLYDEEDEVDIHAAAEFRGSEPDSEEMDKRSEEDDE